MNSRWIRILLVLLLPAATHAAHVMVIRGSASTPNAAEAHYAAITADFIQRLLDNTGIPYRSCQDEDSPSVLTGRGVAILPYNPHPPPEQLNALARFVRRGGKLIVFYSASAELAAIMQLQLGPYMATDMYDRWSQMVFTPSAPTGVPGRIRQRSGNIRPALPAHDREVIAYWQNLTDRQQPEPAIVRSAHGFWFSHIFLRDGDTAGKEQALLALLGDLLPDVWPIAARHAVTQTQLSGYNSYEDSVQAIRAQAPHNRRVATALRQAEAVRLRAHNAYSNQHYPQAIDAARILRGWLLRAYGMAQTRGSQTEMRGVWDHTGTGLYPGDWDRTCRLLAAHGINTLFVNVAWGGLAHYPSAVLPESKTHIFHGDQLRQAVAAARRHNLRIHAWKVCWKLDGAPAELVAELRRSNRLLQDARGQERNWLCPVHDANLRMTKDAIREMVTQYDVDGIHLDYIRFPDMHGCVCSVCHKTFEQHLGRTVSPWPDAIRSGALREQYRTWRVEQITRLVRDVRAFTRSAPRPIQVSAAVFGKYPSCVPSVAQDWHDWLEKNYVDFVVPMNYTESTATLTDLLHTQTAIAPNKRSIISGIGVTAAESRLDAIQTIHQIKRTRQYGTGGFVLFDLTPILEHEVLPILSLGLTPGAPPGRKEVAP